MNLLCSAANTLLADLTNILVTGFKYLALFIRLFRQLHHDELAVSLVLGVQLHDGVGSRSGA